MSALASILVESRSVYGEWKYYPANRAAEVLAEIAGTKTLSERVLRAAQDLGHEVSTHRGGPVFGKVAA